MSHPRSDPADLLLASGLDLDAPFNTSTALRAGLTSRHLTAAVAAGLVCRPLVGVYLITDVEETLDVRLACVKLVLPPGCVVTDETAAWLHGAPMALAPGAHLKTPLISAYHRPHRRLENDRTQSGSRRLKEHDVVELGGLPVTTPLRTACDLGRLRHRDSAMAAMDALLRLGAFTESDLGDEISRFRGYRGVRQLRALAPIIDAGSESFGESALRLRWHDANLGVRPETQILVNHPGTGQVAFLDLGSRDYRYAIEYDGEQFHGEDRAEHDAERRGWLEDLGWTIGVYRKANVFGRHQDAFIRIRADFQRAKLRARRASAY